jgi:hypothetical protein
MGTILSGSIGIYKDFDHYRSGASGHNGDGNYEVPLVIPRMDAAQAGRFRIMKECNLKPFSPKYPLTFEDSTFIL